MVKPRYFDIVLSLHASGRGAFLENKLESTVRESQEAPEAGVRVPRPHPSTAASVYEQATPSRHRRAPRPLLPAQILVVAALLASGTEGCSVFSSGTSAQAHQTRVDAKLAAADPCAVKQLTPADLEWLNENDTWRHSSAPNAPASDESRSGVYASRAGKCDQQRQAEAHEQTCANAMDAVEKHQTPTSAVLDQPDVSLLSRIVSKTLTAADLTVFDSGLPCITTKSADRVRAAFVVAAANLGAEWVGSGIPDDLIAAASKNSLSDAAAASLREKAESDAWRCLEVPKRRNAWSHRSSL